MIIFWWVITYNWYCGFTGAIETFVFKFFSSGPKCNWNSWNILCFFWARIEPWTDGETKRQGQYMNHCALLRHFYARKFWKVFININIKIKRKRFLNYSLLHHVCEIKWLYIFERYIDSGVLTITYSNNK